MNTAPKSRIRRLAATKYAVTFAAEWTLLVGASLMWNLSSETGSADHSAHVAAQGDMAAVAVSHAAPWLVGLTALIVHARSVRSREEQRRRAERGLQESEERFRELVDLLPQTVFEMDTSGNLIYVNKHGFASTGNTPADIDAGLYSLDAVAPYDRERAASNTKQVLAGQRRGVDEYAMLRKDGSESSAIIYSAPIVRSGQSVGIRGVVSGRQFVVSILTKLTSRRYSPQN